MIKYFELDSDQLSIRNIFDKNFLEIEIHAISNAKPNRNGSYFTPDAMKKGIETFSDKPILGFFNKQNDFESHNGKVAYDPELEKDYWDNSNGEQILGFVRQSDPKEIREESDGLLWIVCNAMVCTQYNYKQVKRLLKDRKKKVSVEVAIKDSEIIDGIEYIYDFELMGITILGSKNGVNIKEGIEGAHLSVLDLFEKNRYNHQKQALVFAYSQLDGEEKSKEDKDLAEKEIGTEGALTVNKSKEAMSDTAWGEVDKTELRNRVVAASNFKEIAGDVFLDLREGWEDGEVSKLKYPVMQIVEDDKLVYNRGALASAKAYAEKNGEEEVLEKLKSIYKHLELEFESEDKYECDDFCEDYEDCKVELHSEEPAEETPSEEPKKNEEECPECGEEKEDPEDDECFLAEMKEKCEKLESKCADLTERCAKSEEECLKFKEKCAEYESAMVGFNEKVAEYEAKIAECDERMKDYEEIKNTLKSYEEKFAAMKIEEQKSHIKEMQDKFKLMSDELKDVIEKCEKCEYGCVEDIDRDIAFIVFQKNMANMKETESKSNYSVNIEPAVVIKKSERKQEETLVDRLRNNINK